MSWRFSLAREEESLAEFLTGIDAWEQLKLSVTRDLSFKQGSETASCLGFQFGTTLKPSETTTNLVKNTSNGLSPFETASSFQGDFRVKTLVAPKKGKASQEKEADYGARWQEPLARYDPDTHSWKIPLSLFDVDLSESSQILPKWGMMRDGECFPLEISGLATYESEFGSWPTPTRHDYKVGINGPRTWSCNSKEIWGPSASEFLGATDGMAAYMDRTCAIGNGQVPKVVKFAWDSLANNY